MLSTISFVAFIITIGLLVYELVLYIRSKDSTSLPNIPEFDQDLKIADPQNATPVKLSNINLPRNPQLILIIILIIMAILFGIGSLWSNKKPSVNSSEVSKQVNVTKLEGIEIYSSEGVLLNTDDQSKLKSGDVIMIGIKTSSDGSIDKARIRINVSSWNVTHETSRFDKEKSIYFVEYEIPVDTQKLIVEAQLHSKKDGWMGD